MMNEELHKPMSATLLAKLTGKLGDHQLVEKLCTSLGQVYGEFLPDLIKSEMDLDVVVAYAGCKTGAMDELIDGLGPNVALVGGSLRNWSPNFVLGCGSGFVLTLMERMLGAMPESIVQPTPRPLSVMELDLAVMVFDKIANVLRSAVNAPGGFEPYLEAPHNIEDRRPPAEGQPDEFAAAIKMSIRLGAATSHFMLIVPQKVLLKTVVTPPKAKIPAIKSDAWTQQITEQVHRSQVTIDARVRMESLTLRTISKLAVGDVIPFMDSEDVHVEVSANGKDLYICEFGKSGEHYTVRVKDTMNSDDELLRHLLN
jgi:flagellar motor switch protein FliM